MMRCDCCDVMTAERCLVTSRSESMYDVKRSRDPSSNCSPVPGSDCATGSEPSTSPQTPEVTLQPEVTTQPEVTWQPEVTVRPEVTLHTPGSDRARGS